MQKARTPASTRLLTGIALLGLVLGLVAVLMLGAAPLLYRTGLQPLPVSFLLLKNGVYVAGAASLVLLVALAGWRRYGSGLRRLVPVALVVTAAVGTVPFAFVNPRNPPPAIHDITTDTENPPVFAAVLPLRAASKASNPTEYAPGDAELQRRAYPDVAPVTTRLEPSQAFARALDAARAMGWTLVAQDPAAGIIEASDTTFWFGFTDDIVIRVAAGADGGSRIDIRSLSRIGRSDVGVNAKRIRAYTGKLNDRLR
jgi:uncharacterized protein (DUF1499 family)